MNREQIIEGMGMAMHDHLCATGQVQKEWHDLPKADKQELYELLEAALTTLETAIHGLADVIAGKAYFAPRGIADGTMQVLLEKEFPGFAGLLAGTHVIVPVEASEAMLKKGLDALAKAGTTNLYGWAPVTATAP